MIYESGDWLVGGKIEVLERIFWNDGLDQVSTKYYIMNLNEVYKELFNTKIILPVSIDAKRATAKVFRVECWCGICIPGRNGYC